MVQANAGIFDTPVEATIRCRSCGIIQFEKEMRKSCIRCHKELRPPEPEPPTPIRILPPDPQPDHIGTRICLRIKIIREMKGLSQQNVASQMGTARTYLTKVENCSVVPTLGQLERLANALGVTMRELTDESLPADYIAVKTFHRGGPDRELIAGIIHSLSKLDFGQRQVLVSAAHSLHRKQIPFIDWARV